MPRIDADEYDDEEGGEPFDDDVDEGPGEHDAHLVDDEDAYDDDGEAELVPCPACGKMVLATAERCHRCGEHFAREAWLVQPSRQQAVWGVAAVLVIVAMLWFVLG